MILAGGTQTVAFGDLDAGVWGVALAGELSLLHISSGDQSWTRAEPALAGASETEEWRISADRGELVVRGVQPPEPVTTEQGFDQLCRVEGEFDGRQLDCPGIRGVRITLGEFAQLRAVWAWFEPDEAVAALALRPRKAAGHSADTVSAAVLDLEGPIVVEEARLSTTYTESGRPSRMGLELWIGEDEAEQYPRRFAGEAAGGELYLAKASPELTVTLMRCHSRAGDGAGVYVLARRA